MRDANEISYHRREKSVNGEGYLTREAAVSAQTAAVVMAAAMATETAAAGSVAGLVVSAVVAAAVAVVVALASEAAEAEVIITNRMISPHNYCGTIIAAFVCIDQGDSGGSGSGGGCDSASDCFACCSAGAGTVWMIRQSSPFHGLYSMGIHADCSPTFPPDSKDLFACFSECLSICLSMCCPSVCQYVCLSVCP